MKFFSVLTGALLASSAAALSVGTTKNVQKALADDLSVPGDNPLNYCAKPEDDILEIETVDLSPNPPTAGHNLTITASGYFNKDIQEGAKVHLQVKYGLITIIRQTADLCDAISNVDLKCPLEKGKMTIKKDVTLPAQIPPGKYTVLADVMTKDEDKVTCLTATVTFTRGGSFVVEL